MRETRIFVYERARQRLALPDGSLVTVPDHWLEDGPPHESVRRWARRFGLLGPADVLVSVL